MWSAVILEFASTDETTALHEICQNHDEDKIDSETLTKTVTSALAASIIASPQRFWGVLRRLGHKQ
jgi:tetraacyldisaccharide-1-P 4'-kinase